MVSDTSEQKNGVRFQKWPRFNRSHHRAGNRQRHKAKNHEIGQDWRAKKFTKRELQRTETRDALVIESVQFFFAMNGLQAGDAATQQQHEHLELNRYSKESGAVADFNCPPRGQRNRGANNGGGDGAGGAPLDAGVAQEFGVGPRRGHITSPLEMRE